LNLNRYYYIEDLAWALFRYRLGRPFINLEGFLQKDAKQHNCIT